MSEVCDRCEGPAHDGRCVVTDENRAMMAEKGAKQLGDFINGLLDPRPLNRPIKKRGGK